MARGSYKAALRAKGIRPIPKFDRLRSNHRAGAGDVFISTPLRKVK